MDTEQVLNAINQDELVELTLSLARIMSRTGYEKEVGDFIYDWLQENGFSTFRQEVTEDRRNVVAILNGSGGGLNLIFNTHMDTKFGAEEDIWTVGELKPEQGGGWIEGDRLFGHGLYNAKGMLASFLIAAKALRQSGAQLKGDLLLTFVVGEIGMAPVDEFQGGRYWGKGVGTRHLLEHGITGDFALVGEPTHNAIVRAQAGAAYFKITVRGEALYTPLIPAGPIPVEANPSAIVKMARVIEVLQEWAWEYEKTHRFEYEGGVMVPKVSFGAVRGGLPYKIGNSVGLCSLYLDVRVPPNGNLLQIKEEVQGRIAGTGIPAEIEPFLFRRGYVARGDDLLVDSIQRANQAVFGKKPDPPWSPVTSMWQDINVFNEVGLPAVSYGYAVMRPTETGLDKEYVRVEDLVGICKSYALTALDICQRKRSHSRGSGGEGASG